MSSLPGKALRTLVESQGLPRDSRSALKMTLVNMISKGANLVFFYQFTKWFTLQTSHYDVVIAFVLILQHRRRHSKSAMS